MRSHFKFELLAREDEPSSAPPAKYPALMQTMTHRPAKNAKMMSPSHRACATTHFCFRSWLLSLSFFVIAGIGGGNRGSAPGVLKLGRHSAGGSRCVRRRSAAGSWTARQGQDHLQRKGERADAQSGSDIVIVHRAPCPRPRPPSKSQSRSQRCAQRWVGKVGGEWRKLTPGRLSCVDRSVCYCI